MSDKNADQIKGLYTELAKIGPSQDWERILKVAKKILGLSVNEKKAFQSKIVCLIHLGKFDEALTSIERNPDASDLFFEKAYCEYRLNKIEDAYSTLSKSNKMTNKEKELLAQVTYRLEKYQESYDNYRDIIKNIDDDFDNERQTNLSAVVSSLRFSNSSIQKELDMSELETKTYELCYNSACISLSKGNYEEAREKLTKAENLCKETFEDDPEEQEALDNEMAIIRVQLAFCLQKMEKIDESLKIYNNVLKTKPSDISVMAVASNNLVCINKDQNVFDSKKRIKAATGPELENKLTSVQRRKIAFNEILFALATNQKDTVQRLMERFKTKFDDKELYALLKMLQLYKDKKYLDAEKVLTEIANSSNSKLIKYYLIQILLIQDKFSEAIGLIKTLDEYTNYKVGILSALVTLFKKQNNKQEITSLFMDVINHLNKTDPNSKDLEIFIRENSNYQIELGNYKQACEMLEKIRALRPTDFRVLSKLINVYSKFDTAKANALSKELPSLTEIQANSKLDIDGLEAQFSLLTSKYSKAKTTGGTGQVKSPGNKPLSTEKTSPVKKAKKKKRKVKLPKDFDPSVVLDPERWIPLRERSYYRGKRNKKKQNVIGKGTQGAVSSSTKDNLSYQASPQKPGAANQQSTDSSDKPKPKPPSASSAKPKNKKKGPKW